MLATAPYLFTEARGFEPLSLPWNGVTLKITTAINLRGTGVRLFLPRSKSDYTISISLGEQL